MHKKKDNGVSPVIATILLISLSVVLVAIVSVSVMSGISSFSTIDTKIVGFTVVVNDNETATVTPVSGKDLPYLQSYMVYLDNGHIQSVPDSGSSVLSGAIITDFDNNVTHINIAGNFTDGITALVFSGKVINKTVVYDPSGGGQYFTMGTNGSVEFTSPEDLESALNDWWHVLHPDSDIAYLQGNQLALYDDITIGKEPLTINQDLEMMYPNTNSGGLSQITFYRAPGYDGPLLVIESGAHVDWNSGTLLTLDGNGDGDAPLMVIEDGASFNVATITMINNTNPDGNGGGIYNAGALTVQSTLIVANNIAKYGGGIFLDTGGSLTISGSSSITGNSATANGGGIFLDTGGSLTMNGGSITGNSATANGGGIFLDTGGSLTMSGGSITANSATENGGGIFNVGSLTLNSGSILSNAAKNGGGIYNSDEGTLSYYNIPISGNSATELGDNYYAEAGSTTTGNGITSQFTPAVWSQQSVTPTTDQAIDDDLPSWS